VADDDKLAVPKADASDAALAIARGALGAVPLVGSLGIELVNQIVAPPLEKRRDAWMEEVGEAIHELQGKVTGLTPEKLAADESFVTVFSHASSMAIRNHQREKLDALRNAVLNAALHRGADETRQMMFLSWVDALTPMHLQLLALLGDPTRYLQEHNIGYQPTGTMGGITDMLTHVTGADRDIVSQAVKDLADRGLLPQMNLGVTMTTGGFFQQRSTPLGNQLLEFIAKPPELN